MLVRCTNPISLAIWDKRLLISYANNCNSSDLKTDIKKRYPFYRQGSVFFVIWIQIYLIKSIQQ